MTYHKNKSIISVSLLVGITLFVGAHLHERTSKIPVAPHIDIRALPEELQSRAVGRQVKPTSPADPPDPSASLTARIEAIKDRGVESSLDIESLKALVNERVAWEPYRGIPVSLGLSYEEMYDGREFIKLNRLKIQSLVAGDSIVAVIPQAHEVYEVLIHDVSVKNETVRWVGKVQNANNSSVVSIAQNGISTYMTISTPEGHYTLSAEGEEGWIAKSGTLFNRPTKLVDVPSS